MSLSAEQRSELERFCKKHIGPEPTARCPFCELCGWEILDGLATVISEGGPKKCAVLRCKTCRHSQFFEMD